MDTRVTCMLEVLLQRVACVSTADLHAVDGLTSSATAATAAAAAAAAVSITPRPRSNTRGGTATTRAAWASMTGVIPMRCLRIAALDLQ